MDSERILIRRFAIKMIIENETVPREAGAQGLLKEEITINAPREIVYRHLQSVQQWPRLLPHVEAIEVIYDDGLYQEFFMTVRGEDGSRTKVRSVRKCDETGISFFQVDPPRFLDYHSGGWSFRQNEAGQCVVTTYHQWRVNRQAAVVYPETGGLSPQDQVKKLLRDHARFALTSWKQILEGGEMTVRDQIVIAAPMAQVYDTFADLQQWRAAIPDVRDVKVLYDDGAHQEFRMTVDRPNGPETVRGFRYLDGSEQIELFQPQPPPGFKRMRGLWSFHQRGEKTEVVASRMFILQAGHTLSPAEVGLKFQEHLKANLALFKQYIENKRH